MSERWESVHDEILARTEHADERQWREAFELACHEVAKLREALEEERRYVKQWESAAEGSFTKTPEGLREHVAKLRAALVEAEALLLVSDLSEENDRENSEHGAFASYDERCQRIATLRKALDEHVEAVQTTRKEISKLREALERAAPYVEHQAETLEAVAPNDPHVRAVLDDRDAVRKAREAGDA